MKKLMIALVAAAAAFGLRAADPGFISGSDFEGIGALDATLWTAAEGAATLTEGSHTMGAKRPTQWAFSDNETNLVIKTTLGSPVTQKIKQTGSEFIGTGIYFDGLVNLTVFDVEDTPPAGDLEDAKLGVYLQLANEDESATNLIVVAKGADGAKNYECYGADLTPGWHRLTIKAIANIYNEDAAAANAGFVVFVDNTPVGATGIEGIAVADLTPNAKKFYDVGQLFASLGGEDATLASIQYDGQGIIDEVTFTTVAPFDAAADTDFVHVTWTAENVTEMTIGGEKFTGGSAYAPITYSGDPKVAQPITVSWIGAGDYVNGNYTITTPSASTPVDLDDQMQLAAAILGTAKFATIAEAVVEANKAASGTLVIKNVAEGDEDVELNNANVALDLNGQTVGEVGVDGGAAITLTNTDTENDAVVEGTVYPAIAVDVKTIKFSIENNSDMEGKPDITVDFGANNWELAAEQVVPPMYWVIQEKQEVTTFTVTVEDAATHSSVSVLSNGTETLEFATSYTLPDDGSFLKVTYTADTEAGYQFVPNQDTEFTLDSDGDAATAPAVEPIEYTITYMYDGKPLTDLEPTSYNVEDTLDLPTSVTLLDVKFEGWYNDEELTDGPVTEIAAGSKGAKTFYAKATPIVNPLDEEIAETVDETGLDEGQKAAVRENMVKLNTACGGIDEAKAWIANIYGETKIDGAKLAATTEDLIATSVAFDLPVMSGDVEVAVAAAEEGVGFTFAITDDDGAVSVAKAKLQQMVKYTAALDTAFGDSTDKVEFDENPDETFTARFVEGPAAGFMKVDLTVGE